MEQSMPAPSASSLLMLEAGVLPSARQKSSVSQSLASSVQQRLERTRSSKVIQ